MRRREFVGAMGASALLGGAMASLPLAARAQRAVPIIGFLHSGALGLYEKRVVAFRKGLSDAGFAEGKDYTIEYRWAEGDYARLTQMAHDLVRRNVAVIFAGGGITSAPAAKAATGSIPEGNITGVSFMTQSLGAKRLGFLNVLAPGVTEIALVMNPGGSAIKSDIDEIQAAAQSTRKSVRIFHAGTPHQIDLAFDSINRAQVGAIMCHPDPFLTSRASQLATLGTRSNKPTMYPSRDYTEVGGLISYGADIRDEYRKAGDYVARLLRGSKPGDLPITQPTKFELVLNLKTAKALGLTIPDSLQLLADEVIE